MEIKSTVCLSPKERNYLNLKKQKLDALNSSSSLEVYGSVRIEDSLILWTELCNHYDKWILPSEVDLTAELQDGVDPF